MSKKNYKIRRWTHDEMERLMAWAKAGHQAQVPMPEELRKQFPDRTPQCINTQLRVVLKSLGLYRQSEKFWKESELQVLLDFLAETTLPPTINYENITPLLNKLPGRAISGIISKLWELRRELLGEDAPIKKRRKTPRPKGGNGKSMWPGSKTVKISLPDDLPSKIPPGSTLRLPKDMPKFDVLSVLNRQAEDLLFDWAQTAYAAMKKSVSPREQALESQNHDLGKQIAGLKDHARTLSEENTKLKAENEHLKGENRELIDEGEALKDELRYLCKLREAVANTPVKRAVL